MTVAPAHFHLASRSNAARQLALQESDPPQGEQGLGLSIHLVGNAAAEGETAAANPKAPEWIDLFPDTRLIEARDGRRWIMESPQAVIDAFVANAADLMIDFDHEAVFGGGFFGGRSPAAGWIDKLRINGTYGLQGHVKSWTPDGRASVENGDYRYTSPWFQTARPEEEDGDDGESDPNDEGLAHVVRVLNVALVNMPALRMTALTSEQRSSSNSKTRKRMDKETLAALGLPETATKAQAHARIAELNDVNTPPAAAGAPDLSQYVPRAEFETISTRLTTAQTDLTTARTQLTDQANASRDAEITAALDEVQCDGRMPPERRAFWDDICRQDDGLAKFRDHMATVPKTIATSQSAADARGGLPAPNRSEHQLPAQGEFTVSQMTVEDRRACKKLRVKPEAFAAARNREREYRRSQEEAI